MQLKKLFNINEPFRKWKYLVVGIIIPYLLLLLIFSFQFYPFVYLMFLLPLIPPLVIISMIKRAKKIGMQWDRLLVYLSLSIILQIVIIKNITPVGTDVCDIKQIFIIAIFMPFQLLLLLMPNRDKMTRVIRPIHYFFLLLYSFFIFIFTSISFQPFMGCALHSPYPETSTCMNIGHIRESMMEELLSRGTSSFKYTKEIFLSVSKKEEAFFLDGWGNKIVFEELDNGYRFISNVDKNQSDWVRQVRYEYIKGEGSECYVDKGIFERFFCQH